MNRLGLSFAALLPGLLMAATGVGAGDLLTASLAGSATGLTVLWAAWVGAILKFSLNEGLARWQMATGTTLLEGWTQRLGAWIRWIFVIYLVLWSVVVGGALINACGVAGTGLWPLSDDLQVSKRIWGIIHAVVGVVAVLVGGFKLFGRLMSVCIAVMFATVVVTVVRTPIDWPAMRGLVVPTLDGVQLDWAIRIIGGVGGTVTILSYGYWIREHRRDGAAGLRCCRIDLTLGYVLTALFGVAMIIIGSKAELSKGPTMALDLAAQLEAVIGPTGKWIFIAGFWGAVFSSLLGVWQSVPYMFADFMALRGGASDVARNDLDKTTAYRAFLIGLAVVPLPLLWGQLAEIQKAYATGGALFMPLVALTLLMMNNRRAWIGSFKNGWVANGMLVITLSFFLYYGARKIAALLS